MLTKIRPSTKKNFTFSSFQENIKNTRWVNFNTAIDLKHILKHVWMAECFTHMDMDNDGKVEVQEFIHFWSDSNDFWDWTEEKREIAKDKLAVRKPVLGLYPTRTK